MQITRNCALCIQLILILVFRSPSNVLAQNASGTISGTVFDALTNQPIPNMIINFYQVREDGTSYYFEPSIKTDINGRYSVQFSPSGYKVSFGVADFMPDCIRHSLIISATYCNPVFYDNADTAATATTISLTSSTIATNINGQLLQSQPVSLTVQVLDIDTLQPISGVMISIYGVLPDMQTGSDGKATNTLLRPNHDILIRIQTSPASPANEYIYTSEWSTVHMGTTDVVIKVYLTHERYLQGTITDKQTGQPLRTTISAKCYDSTVKCIDYNYRSIENNADGSYRLRLIPGQNEISVSTAAFDRRYIDYVTSTLISTAITTNLDVKLEVGGQIAGQLIMPEVIDPQDSELFFAYFTYFILMLKQDKSLVRVILAITVSKIARPVNLHTSAMVCLLAPTRYPLICTCLAQELFAAKLWVTCFPTLITKSLWPQLML